MVAATTRSGMTRCACGRGVELFHAVHLDVRRARPRIRAPMCVRKSARSEISGSRAAFSMTVVPLARTAAMRTLSVAVWLGYSKTIRWPTSRPSRPPGTRPSMLPCTVWNTAPNVERPWRWMSMGRLPKSSPPGSDTLAIARAGQQGPEDDDRGTHLLHQLVGRLGDERGRRVDHEVAGLTPARSGHAPVRRWRRGPRP